MTQAIKDAYDQGYRKGFNDNGKLYLYDKINQKEAKHYFQDNEGNFYVDVDPHGVNIDGSIKIRMVNSNNSQFEIREK